MSHVRLIFEKQLIHAIAVIVLISLLIFITNLNEIQEGQLLGLQTLQWFWAAVIIAILHQVYVWFCWRTQLYKNLLTRFFGEHAFNIYAVGFSILGISRVVVVFVLAISNRETLPADQTILSILAVIMLIPALYLFYSVKKYFGFKRAFGIDHFDESYKDLPFVRQGIFRLSPNAMYVFGFFLLWVPALWYASTAAIVVAAFNHIYIWVHYYSTELPDIKQIYG